MSGNDSFPKIYVRGSQKYYNEEIEDDEDDTDDDEVLLSKSSKEGSKDKQEEEVTWIDLVLSVGGFAKLIACILFLSSALVFNNATWEDHITPKRRINKLYMFYLILPSCDISLAIVGPLVYICLLILFAKKHIRNMIVLDVTYTLVVLLMSLLATMVTMPEVGVVHINAAIMMMTGTLLQVISGITTLIRYCPRPYKKRPSIASQI